MSKEWFTKIKENDSGKTPKRTACSWAVLLLYVIRMTSVTFFVADFIVLIFCRDLSDAIMLMFSLMFVFGVIFYSFRPVFMEIFEDIRDCGLMDKEDLVLILLIVALLIIGIILFAISIS